jgi:hypothetical protein
MIWLKDHAIVDFYFLFQVVPATIGCVKVSKDPAKEGIERYSTLFFR